MPTQARSAKLSINPRWNPQQLQIIAEKNIAKLRVQRGAAAETSPWWSFIHTIAQELPQKITEFVAGEYQFEPMVTYHMPDETMVVWQYQDRLIIRLLLQTIKPLFKYIISDLCFHLAGPSGVKNAINWVEKGLSLDAYQYFLRVDIKGYYASIDRNILSEQLKNTFDDPRLVKYLDDVINIPVIDNAEITLPSTGIARRNSLTPCRHRSGIEVFFSHFISYLNGCI